MKPENNTNFLERLEDRVEDHLQTAIRIFQNLDQEALLKPAANGGWSIAQCLDHLNSYGDFYLPELELAYMKSKNKPAQLYFKSGWLGNYFTKMMDPASGKKYRAMKNHMPSLKLDAKQVVAAFIEQQETLLKFLHHAKSSDMNAVRVPLSISNFIRLKAGDVFGFMVAHNERHMQQAKRNLKNGKIMINKENKYSESISVV